MHILKVNKILTRKERKEKESDCLERNWTMMARTVVHFGTRPEAQ